MFICPLDTKIFNILKFMSSRIPNSSPSSGRSTSYFRSRSTGMGLSRPLSNVEASYLEKYGSGVLDSGSDFGFNVVSQMILNSSVYKQAYQLFSSDKSYGQPYLQQLELIPYAHSVRDSNFWDDFANTFGGTSGFDNAVQDAFNTASSEIRSLVSQYHSFKNSLPSEQVQQFAEAGVNSALTGEGIMPSTMSPDGIVSENIPSQTQYSNEQLSNGVTSFVTFIGSVASMIYGGISSANIMGLLDVAERESLNKQEVHDLFLAQLGVKPTSDRTVLDTEDSTVQDIVSKASADARVASASSVANAKALDKQYDVPNLTSPDSSGSVIMSGLDVLNQVSEFSIVSRLGDSYTKLNNSVRSAQYSDILSVLEQEEAVTSAQSGSAQNEFNFDYYTARNGATEGANETTISSRLSELRRLDIAEKQFNEMLSDYRQQTLSSWAQQIHDKPHLAPFFYKALFDFGMSDTFYHQSVLGQGVKYGMDNLNTITKMVGNIIGFSK